jgi:hypothetical protein
MREDAKRGMIDPGRGTEQGTVLALSFVVAFATLRALAGPLPVIRTRATSVCRPLDAFAGYVSEAET